MGSIQHSTPAEAKQAHDDAMATAVEAGKWMAVVWRVIDGKLQLVGMTTCDFPNDDKPEATAQLGRLIVEEKEQAQAMAVPIALKPADIPGMVKAAQKKSFGNGAIPSIPRLPLEKEQQPVAPVLPPQLPVDTEKKDG